MSRRGVALQELFDHNFLPEGTEGNLKQLSNYILLSYVPTIESWYSAEAFWATEPVKKWKE